MKVSGIYSMRKLGDQGLSFEVVAKGNTDFVSVADSRSKIYTGSSTKLSLSSSRSSFIGMTRDSSDKHFFRLETWKLASIVEFALFSRWFHGLFLVWLKCADLEDKSSYDQSSCVMSPFEPAMDFGTFSALTLRDVKHLHKILSAKPLGPLRDCPYMLGYQLEFALAPDYISVHEPGSFRTYVQICFCLFHRWPLFLLFLSRDGPPLLQVLPLDSARSLLLSKRLSLICIGDEPEKYLLNLILVLDFVNPRSEAPEKSCCCSSRIVPTCLTRAFYYLKMLEVGQKWSEDDQVTLFLIRGVLMKKWTRVGELFGIGTKSSKWLFEELKNKVLQKEQIPIISKTESLNDHSLAILQGERGFVNLVGTELFSSVKHRQGFGIDEVNQSVFSGDLSPRVSEEGLDSFFLQMGFTLILATLDGLDVGLLGDVIGEDDFDDDG
ncbi:hypothetical protein Tco_1302652 [Tanacetum coccineum]